jgi:hypothetical protein
MFIECLQKKLIKLHVCVTIFLNLRFKCKKMLESQNENLRKKLIYRDDHMSHLDDL